ncbi:hypothetical protein DPX16_19483 [Anabarilius grahami]|uniref:Uncharacterized protein n=1 Tax=Anabarilius grahami TaxID=495550 RepID=A0A3N0Z1E4_ANAGA|nr:hypothetical protein DPX16_19483 [Anabarilius grahami]
MIGCFRHCLIAASDDIPAELGFAHLADYECHAHAPSDIFVHHAVETLKASGGVGVEELDPPYVLFGSAKRAEGMPDEVSRHAVECLLKIKEGHVYWLVLLPPVPLQQQPDGLNRISSPAPSNKSTLIGTDRDDLPEMGVDYALEYLHGMAAGSGASSTSAGLISGTGPGTGTALVIGGRGNSSLHVE